VEIAQFQHRCLIWLAHLSVLSIAALSIEPGRAESPAEPCAIEIIDRESGWPVPLVKLRTTHQVQFISDNAGRIAFDVPELMGRETWLFVEADGYEVPADGFGSRGVRIRPEPGKRITVEIDRTAIARRLGRLVYRGRLFWAWGDTILAHYPLGILHMTAATTAIQPIERFEPPLRLKMRPFTDSNGRTRAVAQMPGDGPTWLNGLASLLDKNGRQRLVATYSKIKPPLEAYESGLCAWNDELKQFEHLRTIWKKTDDSPARPPMPQGHCVIVDEKNGKKWALFGDPLPTLRCAAAFESWQDPSTWETLEPQESFSAATGAAQVKPHGGSIAWNAYRQRWVTVFMQVFGKPSAFGEVWYAEADSPYGPWGPAVKVLSHRNYTFYGVRLHPEVTPADSPILLFEGTYTQAFADRPEPTPRYDYNQVLYRLDLDDPKLAPAQKKLTDAAAGP
jgi:hypothetical protein